MPNNLVCNSCLCFSSELACILLTELPSITKWAPREKWEKINYVVWIVPQAIWMRKQAQDLQYNVDYLWQRWKKWNSECQPTIDNTHMPCTVFETQANKIIKCIFISLYVFFMSPANFARTVYIMHKIDAI